MNIEIVDAPRPKSKSEKKKPPFSNQKATLNYFAKLRENSSLM